MPVIREELDEGLVRAQIRQQGFGFVNVVGGWVVLNQPSKTATRGNGAKVRVPCPGRISPQVWRRLLTFADSVKEAAAQAIAMALGKTTDPVLPGEPVGAPQLSFEQMEKIIKANLDNAVAVATEPMSKRLAALEDENKVLRAQLGKEVDGKGKKGKVTPNLVPSAADVSRELSMPLGQPEDILS